MIDEKVDAMRPMDGEDPRSFFGRRNLARVKARLGWSQQDIVDATGASQSTVSKMLAPQASKPFFTDHHQLRDLAEHTGQDIDDFFLEQLPPQRREPRALPPRKRRKLAAKTRESSGTPPSDRGQTLFDKAEHLPDGLKAIAYDVLEAAIDRLSEKTRSGE